MSEGYISCFRIPLQNDLLCICSHTQTPEEMVAEANTPNVLRLAGFNCLLSKKVSSPKAKEDTLEKIMGYKKYVQTYYRTTLDEVYTLFELIDGEFVIGNRAELVKPVVAKQEEEEEDEYTTDEDENEEDYDEEEEEPTEDEDGNGYISCTYSDYHKTCELHCHKDPSTRYRTLLKQVKFPSRKLANIHTYLSRQYKHLPFTTNEYLVSLETMKHLFDLMEGEYVVTPR